MIKQIKSPSKALPAAIAAWLGLAIAVLVTVPVTPFMLSLVALPIAIAWLVTGFVAYGSRSYTKWAIATVAIMMMALTLLTTPAEAQAASWPVLERGDRGTKVKALQYLLTAHGYSTSADGIFGPETQRQVKSFQRPRRLSVDGIVGPETWGQLAATATMRQGSRGPAVKAIQIMLNERGAGLAVNGNFGSRTKKAVQSFQEAVCIKADGIVGPETWRYLMDGRTGRGNNCQVGSSQKSVLLDPGHGGSDSGAVGNGMREKNINLDVARRVRNILEHRGVKVYMTRAGGLTNRVQQCNNANPDLMVSIHTNAGGGTGPEAFYSSYFQTKSFSLSNKLAGSISNATGLRNRGPKNGSHLAVLKCSKAPSSLVELAFIDSPKKNEIDLLKNSRDIFAGAIARAILAELNR